MSSVLALLMFFFSTCRWSTACPPSAFILSVAMFNYGRTTTRSVNRFIFRNPWVLSFYMGHSVLNVEPGFNQIEFHCKVYHGSQ